MCCSSSEIQVYIWSCSTLCSKDRTESWGGYKRAGSDKSRLQNMWWGELREALAVPSECSCTSTDTAVLPWAGLAPAALPVSTHPTAGTVLVALPGPPGGQVPSSVALWHTKDLLPHHPEWFQALNHPSSGHCWTVLISISLVWNSSLFSW